MQKSIVNAQRTTSQLQDSVAAKRINICRLKLQLKLYLALNQQVITTVFFVKSCLRPYMCNLCLFIIFELVLSLTDFFVWYFFPQIYYLNQWSSIEREHTFAVKGAIEDLKASTLRLPVTGCATVGHFLKVFV